MIGMEKNQHMHTSIEGRVCQEKEREDYSSNVSEQLVRTSRQVFR